MRPLFGLERGLREHTKAALSMSAFDAVDGSSTGNGCQDGLGVGGIVLCEAVTRANMRFVETKTAEQQSCLMLHRTRQLFIRQQTSVINAIRAHMAEFGIVAPVGRHGVEALLEVVADVDDNRVPEVARGCLVALGAQHSSGGKDQLGSISKQGDRYLRSLFTAGALAVIRYAKIHGTQRRPWLTALLARRPTKVAAIALANKIARMAWAMSATKNPSHLRREQDRAGHPA